MSKFKEKWNDCPKVFRYLSYFIFGDLGLALLGFLFGLIIKLLWNWLMPELFGLDEITYWQGIGLFLLGRLLFGSIGKDHDKVEVNCKNNNCKKEYVKEVKVEYESDID